MDDLYIVESVRIVYDNPVRHIRLMYTHTGASTYVKELKDKGATEVKIKHYKFCCEEADG